MRARLAASDTVTLLRWGLLALAAISILGLSVELVFLKHWDNTQVVVWAGIAGLTISLALLVFGRSRRTVRAAQGLALVVGFIAVVGMAIHISENRGAGALDRQYADRWDTMTTTEQLWAAATGEVGGAPTLAPGALAQAAALLLLATIRHPALRDDSDPTAD